MQLQTDPSHRIQYSSRFFVLLGVFILCNFLIFPAIGYVFLSGFYDISWQELPSILSNPDKFERGVNMLIWLQIISSFGGFFVTAFVFLKSYNYNVFDYLGLNRKITVNALIVSILIIFSNIAIVDLLGALNYRIPIPDIAGLKETTASMNERVSKLMESLLVMNSYVDLLVRLFAMALLPAFVEEVFFRGLLQRFVSEWFGSAISGIVVSALVFSLFHFRFEQIIPIFYVGLLFGFIYHRTKNLTYTIIMHFIHNGFIVALTYFVGGTDAKEFMKEDFVPGASWVIPSLIGLIAGIYLLLKMFPTQLNSNIIIDEKGGKNE